jgi:RHS repeat-associated protein
MTFSTAYPFKSTVFPTFSCEKYRFGFNGKENDNEVKGDGNSVDYGGRIYDSRLGRWLSLDPKFSKAPNWSPYRFGFDNPLRFIDKDGNFELYPDARENYPKLAYLVDHMVEIYKNSTPEFKQALQKWSNLSEKEILECLTPGSGPMVRVEDIKRAYKLKVDANGMTETRMRKDGTYDDTRNWVNPQTNKEQGLIILDVFVANYVQEMNTPGAQLLAQSTIFHELTHYGLLKTIHNANKEENQTGDCSGKKFEKEAYGDDINRFDAECQAKRWNKTEGKSVLNNEVNTLSKSKKSNNNQNKGKTQKSIPSF